MLRVGTFGNLLQIRGDFEYGVECFKWRTYQGVRPSVPIEALFLEEPIFATVGDGKILQQVSIRQIDSVRGEVVAVPPDAAVKLED